MRIRFLTIRVLLLSIFYVSCFSLASEEKKKLKHPVFSINFGFKSNPKNVIYANELESQAKNRNLLLVSDNPAQSLLDHEAEVIPNYGLRFFLDSPNPLSFAYLCLDLVSYKYQDNAPKTQVNWLSVKVNKKQIALLYSGGERFFDSPVVIPIERILLKSHKNHIELLPSPHSPVFAIWDVFITDKKPEKRERNNPYL